MIPNNQKKYAICDNAIAVLKEDSNACGMVYIYPIYTIDHETPKQEEEQYFDGYYYKFDDNLDKAKIVCYSKQLIENSYSTMFMSLSKDGRYLALSWLPNPRLGPNHAMKYCMVYDLIGLIPCEIIHSKDISLTLPIRIIEFYGGCSFTAEENKLVLLNQNQVRVYAFSYNVSLHFESLDLEYSLDLSNTYATLSAAYNYDNRTPTYFLFSLADNCPRNVISSQLIKSKDDPSMISNSATNRMNDDDLFFSDQEQEDDETNSESNSKDEDYTLIKDDLSFDERNDLFYNEEEQDDFPSDLETNDMKQQESCKKTESTSHQYINDDKYDTPLHHQMFDKDNEFIKMNIDNVKLYNVICCVSSLEETSTKTNLYVWSLEKKKIIHYNPLKENNQYLTAFSKGLNLVAISKKYDENNHLTRLFTEPAVNIYDCKSGVAIVQLFFPKDRSIAGITQVLFLQNDNYIMTVSFSYNECSMDIWDIGTGMHLDCFTKDIDHRKVFVQESQFFLNDNIQLLYGCGVFIRVEISQELTSPHEPCLPAGSRHLYIQRVKFFKTNYNHACQCQSTKFWTITKPSLFTGEHVLTRRREKTSLYKSISCSVNLSGVAYFLDQNQSYLMTCYKKMHHRQSFVMTVWKVTAGVSCRRKTDCHKMMVTLNHVVYSFIYSVGWSLNDPLAGYPALFLDLKRGIQTCIHHMNPIIVTPPNANGVPVLLIKINDALDKTNCSLVLHRQDEGTLPRFFSYTLAIPLHAYSLIECHLHVLANGTNTPFSYETFTDIVSIYQLFFFKKLQYPTNIFL